jgi:hypothetical protein
VAGGTAIQGGVAGDVGLYIYSDRPGPILVREDDPFAAPGGGPVDNPSETLHTLFLDNMAPQPETLAAIHNKSAVNVYSLPGACVRSPFGVLNSQLMTATVRKNTFLNGTAGTVKRPSIVGHEALVSYCHAYSGNRYQSCDGDARTYEERRDFCTNTRHADEITVAWAAPKKRVPCYTAPDKSGAVCTYYPGDTDHTSFTAMLESIDKDVEKVAIVVAPFSYTVATQMQAGMHVYSMSQTQYPAAPLHTLIRSMTNFGAGTQRNALPEIEMCTASAGDQCRHMLTRSQLRLVEDVQTAIAATTETTYDAAVAYVKDSFSAIVETFTAPGSVYNTSTGTVCSSDQVAIPTARTVSHDTPLYECGPITSFLPTVAGRRQTITRPGVTVTTVGNNPITFTPATTPHCAALVVAGNSFTVTHPLVIDQSLCTGPESDMIGVVVVGPDARNTSIVSVDVVRAPQGKFPAAVAALGYDSEFGTKTVVNVTGFSATVAPRTGAYDYAFAHAVAATVVGAATTTGTPPAVLIQEARSEHFPVNPTWRTFNVSNYTSVFGWGLEQKLYHQPTRRDRILNVVFVTVAAVAAGFMVILLGLCALVTHEVGPRPQKQE